MTLSELAYEYNNAYLRLQKRISALKNEEDKFSGNDLIAYKRRIMSLYSDALYCRKIYEKLINYYKK